MTLTGHEGAWRQWREARAGHRMHHAWLLTGKRGIGKGSFAAAAAAELVGGPSENRMHPDIVTLTHAPKDEKEEAKRADGKPFELARSIRIGQIRALQQRLTTRPTMSDRRAVIIDPADDLERNAANALLKSLEEPPEGTIFLLVAHSPARLLPTIRSRCRVLRFPALSEPAMSAVLDRAAPEARPEARASAIAFAQGSPGLALRFLELDLGPVARVIEGILASGDPDRRLRAELASMLGARADRDRTSAIIELARTLASDEARLLSPAGGAAMAVHGELGRLAVEHASYNYDAGMLALAIGSLLARLGTASERGDG